MYETVSPVSRLPLERHLTVGALELDVATIDANAILSSDRLLLEYFTRGHQVSSMRPMIQSRIILSHSLSLLL